MKEVIITFLEKVGVFRELDIDSLLEIPPSPALGDVAFPCFALAKSLKKSPVMIAQELKVSLDKDLPSEIEKIVVAGAYLNFFINKKFLAEKTLQEVKKKSFGSSMLGKKKRLGLEFSQPNTHKAFHVGHIRGTSIGESLARISEFCGNKVIRINYSGDTGMHIAKWLWCYQKYHANEPLRNDESWIAGIYVDAVKRLGEQETLQEEVDEINRTMESRKDKELNRLWKKTRELSIHSWERIYDELQTHFDKHYFESEMEEEGKMIAEELYKKHIAKKDDAIFMDLKDYGLSVWVLLRKDGTVLYSAKDLALAVKKVKELKLDRSLVAVGDEQQLHFRQLVKTLELMRYKKAKDYQFITFGMVRFPEGKMSSRTGKNILYSDFFQEVVGLAKEGIMARGYQGVEVELRARKIAVAAIKYTMLKQDSIKPLIFNPEESIKFEGDTGPYLLYSYARANSILKKVMAKKAKMTISSVDEKEFLLIKKIANFTSIVKQAYTSLAPNVVASYAFELSQVFNEFYHACPVLGNEKESFRLALVDAFKITLKKSLDLLGIDTLEEM